MTRQTLSSKRAQTSLCVSRVWRAVQTPQPRTGFRTAGICGAHSRKGEQNRINLMCAMYVCGFQRRFGQCAASISIYLPHDPGYICCPPSDYFDILLMTSTWRIRSLYLLAPIHATYMLRQTVTSLASIRNSILCYPLRVYPILHQLLCKRNNSWND